jgi:hypothetical protein
MRKRFIIALVSLVVAGFGAVLVRDRAEATPLTKRAIEQISKDEFTQYVQDRTETLRGFAKQDRAMRVASRVSFKVYTEADALQQLSNDNALTVRQMYFGWGSNRGGFNVQQGQTLAQAIAAAKQAHAEFFKVVGQKEQPAALAKSFQEYKQASEAYGLPLYAIDVEASVGKLEQLQANPAVRFVDVDPGKGTNFMVPASPSDFVQ